MYYYVHFHADGGQACCPGVRGFPTRNEAETFAAKMRAEPGHTCGPESVTVEEADELRQDKGFLYWKGDVPSVPRNLET